MSIVSFFKDNILKGFFSKQELPPEVDETFDIPVITDDDVNEWLSECADAEMAEEGVDFEDEKEWSVLLIHPGDKKVNVLKAVREATGLGLKECVELVDTFPVLVLSDVSYEDAEAFHEDLEQAGAKAGIFHPDVVDDGLAIERGTADFCPEKEVCKTCDCLRTDPITVGDLIRREMEEGKV